MDKGINLRSTATFVTDGANETYYTGSDSGAHDGEYPVTRAGVTFGWLSFTGDDARDWDGPSVDRRLAGLNFKANSGTPSDFRVDTPSTGVTTIHLGGTDHSGTNDYIQIRDGNGLLATVATAKPVNSTGGSHSIDATGTVYLASAWPASEAGVDVTLTTSFVLIRCGSSSAQSGETTLSHIRVAQADTGTEGTVAAAESESISATGTTSMAGAAAFSEAEKIAATPTQSMSGTGAASESEKITADAVESASGTAQTAESEHVAADGAESMDGTVAASENASVAATGNQSLAGDAALSESEHATADGVQSVDGAAAAVESEKITADGTTDSASAELSESESIHADGVTSLAADSAELSESERVAASGTESIQGTASAAEAERAAATGSGSITGAVEMSESESIAAHATISTPGAARALRGVITSRTRYSGTITSRVKYRGIITATP